MSKLKSDEFDFMASIVVQAIDVEFARLVNASERESVSVWLTDFYINTKLHTMFVERHIAGVVENIFGDIPVRDYILTLTDRINILLTLDDLSRASIIETLVIGFTLSRYEGTASLSVMPLGIATAIKIDYDAAIMFLNDNAWYVTLILIFLFFERSATYQAVINLK